MLWCIGITDLDDGLSKSICSLYMKDGKFLHNPYVFYIFDDNDFSVECIDSDYLIKCRYYGVVIKGIKKDDVVRGKVHYYVNVTSPSFSKDVKLIKRIDITKSTGYFNENFCRFYNTDTPCKFLRAGIKYFYIDNSNNLSKLEYDKFIEIVNTNKVPFIDISGKSFILGDFKSNRTRVLNYCTLCDDYRVTVIDLLDYHWYCNDVIGLNFNVDNSTIEINTPTSIYKFKLSNRLKIWVLKRKLISSKGIFFDDRRRILL